MNLARFFTLPLPLQVERRSLMIFLFRYSSSKRDGLPYVQTAYFARLPPAAVTHRTCMRSRARLRTGAVTCIACLCSRNGNIRFLTEYRFLEFNRHRILQIVPR